MQPDTPRRRVPRLDRRHNIYRGESMSQSSALADLLADDKPAERVATGFSFTEGPIWMPDGSLHFSDIVADIRRRWHPTEGVSVLRDPSNICNGTTLDSKRRLVMCEHATSRMVRESS